MENTILSDEDVKLLAQVERDIENNRVPFVKLNGGRLLVMPEVMKFFGLEQGQNITIPIYTAILKKQIEIVENKINKNVLDSDIIE